MGANQSQCHKQRKGRREGDTSASCDTNSQPLGKAPRGKPSPPSQPFTSDVTHSSVTLSWQPPRRSCDTIFAYTIEMTTPSEPKAWTAVTKSCQGNRYQVKNLDPSSQYLFRVRAENIHGLSKGSRPSDCVETKMFGVDQQQGFLPAPEDNRARSLQPRHPHPINLHLESTVTSILNHTDIQVNANTSPEVGRKDLEGLASPESDRGMSGSLEALASRADEVDSQGGRWRSSSLQRDGYGRSCVQPERFRSHSLQRETNGRSSLQADRWRSSSLQREAYQRSSWQPSRKRSLPILLPGTRTDSLNKLRDSQTFPVPARTRLNEGQETGRKRGLSWRDRSVSDADTSMSESKENVGKGVNKEESGTAEDPKPAKRDSGLEEDADNPWEREDSSSEVSDGVGSGEDKKGEHSSRPSPDTANPSWTGVTLALTPGGEGGQADFRTLRSLLHSDDFIVRPALSLPDVGRKSSPHNTLSTILDQEEEEDSVRITTL